MAVLTWRNVDAPDFRSVTDASRNASDLMNQAFKSASDGLTQFKDQRAEGADQAALAESLKFTDPAAYQEALRSGAIQQQNMSSKGTAALGARVGDLIAQASNKLTLDQAPELFAQNTQANADISNGRQQAFANTDYGQARRVGDDERTDTLRADTEASDAIFSQISEKALTGDSASERFREAKANLTPQGQRLLQAKLEGRYKVAFDGPDRVMEQVLTDNDGNTLFPENGSDYVTDIPETFYNRTVADTPHSGKPMSASTVDEWAASAEEVRKATEGRKDLRLKPGEGSSASGAYQMIYPTLRAAAEEVFGKKEAGSVVLTPAVQEQLAEHIYNQKKGGDLSKTWQGLEKLDRPAGHYKDVPWSEARKDILSKEVGATPTATAPVQNAPAPVDPVAELIAAVQPTIQGSQQEVQTPSTAASAGPLDRLASLGNGVTNVLYGTGKAALSTPLDYLYQAGTVAADGNTETMPGSGQGFRGNATNTLNTGLDQVASAFDGTGALARKLLGVQQNNPELYQAATAQNTEAGVAPTGTQPGAPVRVNDSAQAVAATALDQQDSLMRDRVTSGAAQDYIENIESKASVPEVVDALIGKEFPGADRPAMINQINHLVAETGVNPAIAAAMMKRTQEGSGFWSKFNVIHNNPTTNSNNLGGGNRIDDTRMATLIEAMRTRASLGQAYDQGTQETATTTLRTASDQLIAATKSLSQVRNLAANGGTDQREVDRAAQRQRQAQALLNSITGKQ
jgi:hypothetical protein